MGNTTADTAKRRMTEFLMFKYASTAYPHNKWPEQHGAAEAGFKRAVDDYVAGVMATARALLPLVAQALGQPSDFFAAAFSDPTAQFRCNHYPADPAHADGAVRIGAHTDSSFMTLLPQRPAQVRKTPNWSRSWANFSFL